MAAILPSTPPPFVSKCNIQTLPNFLNQEANGDDPVPPRVVLADLTNRRTGPIRRIKQRSKSVITAEVRVKRVSDNPNVPTFHLHPQVHHPAANTATAAAAMHLVAYEVYSRYRIQKFKKCKDCPCNRPRPGLDLGTWPSPGNFADRVVIKTTYVM